MEKFIVWKGGLKVAFRFIENVAVGDKEVQGASLIVDR